LVRLEGMFHVKLPELSILEAMVVTVPRLFWCLPSRRIKDIVSPVVGVHLIVVEAPDLSASLPKGAVIGFAPPSMGATEAVGWAALDEAACTVEKKAARARTTVENCMVIRMLN